MLHDQVQRIPIAHLHRSISTPREHVDEAALERLAHWIRRRGLLQPILVRAINPTEFEVVAGERRLLAAQRAGLSELDCCVRTYIDTGSADTPLGDVYALEDALIENLVRENLDTLEESEAILELVCLHVGETRLFVLERLAALHHRARKSREPLCICDEDDRILEVFAALHLIGWQSFYTHRASLLALPDEVKTLIHRRSVSYSTARRIGRLEPDVRATLIARISIGELRGAALNDKLNQLLSDRQPTVSRLSRLRRALRDQLENPRVSRLLVVLERELGLA